MRMSAAASPSTIGSMSAAAGPSPSTPPPPPPPRGVRRLAPPAIATVAVETKNVAVEGATTIVETLASVAASRGIDWEDSVLGDCEMMNIAYVQSKVWQRVKASYTWQFAFMMAITFWRTVKYLQVSPLVNAPKTAISSGSSEMLALFIVYALLSLGFGWIFYVNFYMRSALTSIY